MVKRLAQIVVLILLMQDVNANIGFFATISGGEIEKADSYDMVRTTALYEFGIRVESVNKSIKNGLQLEIGYFNQSPAYSAGFDINFHFPVVKNILGISAGGGLAYNGFVKNKYLSLNSMKGEFIHRYSPMIRLQSDLFEKGVISLEGLFESEIMWKARFGYSLFQFR